MNFKLLEKTRYISDGDADTVVIHSGEENLLNDTKKQIKTY